MKRNKKKCEKCGKNISLSNYNKHISSCKNKKSKRFEIKEEWKLPTGNYKCPQCGLDFSKNGLISHFWRKHTVDGKEFNLSHTKKIRDKRENPKSWNKGLTKETDDRVKRGSNKLKEKYSSGELKNYWDGKKMSEETKQKISNGLKKAHKEGRHPGWSFVNSDINKRSYPEKFFNSVFKERGLFKKYKIIEKMSFSKYSLDFAIVDLKLDVEIDGQQYFRTKEAIEHDKKRDSFVNSKGWKVYRICWKKVINNKQKEISELIEFIDNIDKYSNRYYNINEALDNLYNKNFEIKIENEKIKTVWKKKYNSREEYNKVIRKGAIEKNEPKINKILNSDIDFSKFGWVKKASNLIEIKPQKVNGWMKKYMLDFYEKNCFKRK